MNIPGIVMSIFTGALLILVVAVPALVHRTMNATAPLIAVFDVGKTNAKIALVDPALGQGDLERAPPERRRRRARRRASSTWSRIEAWLLDSLRQARRSASASSAIVPIAHGAAAVLVDHEGAVLAAPDYEDTLLRRGRRRIRRAARSCSLTFSPHLPHGLNLGRQLYLPADAHAPSCFERAAHMLMYPQYWSWRLSGVMSTEVTSLGTHTDLWRPHEQTVLAAGAQAGLGATACRRCAFAPRRGSARIRASRRGRHRPAGNLRGVLRHPRFERVLPALPRWTASAKPSPWCRAAPWTIVMANRGDLRRLREDRDMLANVNAFGAPVATARYMGGREYEAIARGAERAHRSTR